MSYDISKTIRVNKKEWDKANVICKDMNTTLSGVVNQLIRQIIIQEAIPFRMVRRKENNVAESKEELTSSLYYYENDIEEDEEEMEETFEEVEEDIIVEEKSVSFEDDYEPVEGVVIVGGEKPKEKPSFGALKVDLSENEDTSGADSVMPKPVADGDNNGNDENEEWGGLFG